MRFREKPVVIEAEQFLPQFTPWPDGVEQFAKKRTEDADGVIGVWHGWRIKTLEGPMGVSPGDWIITGVKGEKYPCKPDIFEQTYDRVDD